MHLKLRALRWLLAVAGLLAWRLVVAGPAAAAAGHLDPSFGGDGKVTTDFNGQAGANAVVVQDGKLVAAGFGLAGSIVDFALARYRHNGTLDPTFGTGGRVTTGFADVLGGDELVNALVLRDGKLVAAGSTITASGGQRFALARYK